MIRCPDCGCAIPRERTERQQNVCRCCGNSLAPDAVFCVYCGAKTDASAPQGFAATPWEATTTDAQPIAAPTKRKVWPWIVAAAAILVIAIVVAVLLLNGSSDSKAYGGGRLRDRETAAQDNTFTETGTNKPTAAETTEQTNAFAGQADDGAVACADWYAYSEGEADLQAGIVVGYRVFALCLHDNGEAEIRDYIAYSDCSYTFTGTWSYRKLSDVMGEISLDLSGGYTGLTVDDEPAETVSCVFTMTVDITDEWMTVMGITGDDRIIPEGLILQKNFTPDLWEADVIGTMRTAAGN